MTPESLETQPINFGLIFSVTEKIQQLLLYARVVEEQCQTLEEDTIFTVSCVW